MDDTAVFATSHENPAIYKKNPRYINVNYAEKADLKIDEIIISHMGTAISNDSVSQQVKSYLCMKSPHTLKFYSFLNENTEANFTVQVNCMELPS